MKKLCALLLAVLLMMTAAAGEGLLPSFHEILGVELPSMSAVLGRAPDEEAMLEDGSVRQVFRGVTGENFDAFSAYLAEKNCTVESSETKNRVFTAVIARDGSTFSLRYDIAAATMELVYPDGTYPEGAGAEIRHEAKNVAVGDIITFGHYPQTAEGTDSTPIEWIVLEVDGSKALLISKYGLDSKPYNTVRTDVTWETCSLRTWLNRDFLNKAFSGDEQEAILTTTVDNSASQCFDFTTVDPESEKPDDGNNTQDKLFLMSYAEALQYFDVQLEEAAGAAGNMKSRVAPTAYAVKNGAVAFDDLRTADGAPAGWWWLRSPGGVKSMAVGVDLNGSLYYSFVNSGSGCVRPALWVDLDSGMF